MDRWTSYLFESHSEETLRAWARRLGMFRFCRAYGGHANDGDSLNVAFAYRSPEELEQFCRQLEIPLVKFSRAPPQPTPGVSYPFTEFAKFPSLIPDTRWLRQPRFCTLAGHDAYVRCSGDVIEITVSAGYAVDEQSVRAAEAIERLLADAPLLRVDPPIDDQHCICPKYYPDFFA